MKKDKVKQSIIALGMALLMCFSTIVGAANCANVTGGNLTTDWVIGGAAESMPSNAISSTYVAGPSTYTGTWEDGGPAGYGMAAVTSPLGANIEYSSETDAVFNNGLAYKLGNQASTTAAMKSFRFPGGGVSEHYTLNTNGVAGLKSNSVFNNASAKMTWADVPGTDTNWHEFLIRAKQAGIARIFFVANVQEAYARCMPDSTTSSANCTRSSDNNNPYSTISAALNAYGTKAKDWAEAINTYLASTELYNAVPASTTYKPDVYWELGNEVYLASGPGSYQLTVLQYEEAIKKIGGSVGGVGIRSASSNNTYSGWRIGVVGPVSGGGLIYPGPNDTENHVWWSYLKTKVNSYYDFAVVHGNYGFDLLGNPFFTTNSDCLTNPPNSYSDKVGQNGNLIGKRDPFDSTVSTACRNSQYHIVDGGIAIANFASSGNFGKPVAITEWNTSDAEVNDSGWLNPQTPIPQANAMVNFASTIGDYFSAGVSNDFLSTKLLSAIVWPTRGSSGAQDYRGLVNFASNYASTLNQVISVDLKDALTGSWQGDTAGDIKKYWGTNARVKIWQTSNTNHRYIVVVNHSDNNVKVPLTLHTAAAPTIYVTGEYKSGDATATAINCTIPKPSGDTTFNMDVKARSVSIFKVYR